MGLHDSEESCDTEDSGHCKGAKYRCYRLDWRARSKCRAPRTNTIRRIGTPQEPLTTVSSISLHFDRTNQDVGVLFSECDTRTSGRRIVHAVPRLPETFCTIDYQNNSLVGTRIGYRACQALSQGTGRNACIVETPPWRKRTIGPTSSVKVLPWRNKSLFAKGIVVQSHSFHPKIPRAHEAVTCSRVCLTPDGSCGASRRRKEKEETKIHSNTPPAEEPINNEEDKTPAEKQPLDFDFFGGQPGAPGVAEDQIRGTRADSDAADIEAKAHTRRWMLTTHQTLAYPTLGARGWRR